MHLKKSFIIFLFFVCTIFNLSAHDGSMDLFMNHGSIMLMIDPDTGQIAYANKQAARFYKTPLELLLKKKIKDINQLSSIEVEREIVNAKLTKRNYFLFKHRIGTDEIRDVEVYSYPVKHDGKQMLFSVVVDVTDKLAAEAEVKA